MKFHLCAPCVPCVPCVDAGLREGCAGCSLRGTNNMSRVCVKALPKHLTQERFLEAFAGIGEVTDVKLLKTKGGQKRNMGFIGYRNEDDAANAIKLMNNTYLDTSRIQVEVAKPIGSDKLDRPWSKHSKGSSAYTKLHPEERKKRERENEPEENEKFKPLIDKNNPKLLEFLGLHQKTKKWENDDVMAKVEEEEEEEQDQEDEKSKKRKHKDEKTNGKKTKKAKTSKENGTAKENGTLEGKANGKKSTKGSEEAITKKDISQDKVLQDEFGESDDEYEDIPDPTSQALYVGDEEEEDQQSAEPTVDDDEEDDMAYIKSKMSDSKEVLSSSDEESSDEGSSEEDDDEEEITKEGKGIIRKVVDESETGRLFVRNLPFTITEDELRELFAKYGTLSELHVPQDKQSNRSKGIAMVLYMVPSDASAAMRALDGTNFQGRVLHVLPGEEQRQIEKFSGGTNGKQDMNISSFKKEQETKKKAGSTSSHNWNSLYVRSDTVVDAFCAKHGVTKEEVYDPSKPDLAVQLALMETQIIIETKQYFEKNGVNIDILFITDFKIASSVNKDAKRSNAVIIIKNLPFESTSREITQQFEKHGALGRVLVPPNRTVALVEFVNPAEAKSAFKSLAYRKYHGVPLYLEWAPDKVFATPTPVVEKPQQKPQPQPQQQSQQNQQPQQKQQQQDSTEQALSNVLYITNISFKTKDADLIKLFNNQPGYVSMNIPKNMDPKTLKATLSSGTAFVTFESKEDALAALKACNEHMLDRFKLSVDFSKSKKKDTSMPNTPITTPTTITPATATATAEEAGDARTKVSVKNIPFEATQDEVRALFKPLGGFKSLRMPLKMDRSHRGFGFVEFLTHLEAKRALETLAHTHLYGRHLVLEFAEADRSLEQIRAKTARDYNALKGKERSTRPRGEGGLQQYDM